MPDDDQPLFSFTLTQRKPSDRQLERINQVIAAAMGTWNLAERVRRISLPLYQYRQDDLEHMVFVLAETPTSAIVGVAALEEADEPGARYQGALLLHGIYVDPACHRCGIGRALLKKAEAIASATGAVGLLAKAQADAVDFFESCGFEKLPATDRSRDYAFRYWKSIGCGGEGEAPFRHQG